MKTLDKYVCKNFIKSVLICIIAFEGIFVLSQLFKIVRYITGGRLTVPQAGMFVITMIPKMTVQVAPFAVLFGSLIMITRMAGNLEITSLKTGGVRFARICRMPIIISFIISILMFVIYDRVYPLAQAKNKLILDAEPIEKTIPKTKENAFLRNSSGEFIYLMKHINRVTGEAENIEIIHLNENFDAQTKMVLADSGEYDRDNNYWKLSGVRVYENDSLIPTLHDTYIDDRYNDTPDSFITVSINSRHLNIRQLKEAARETRNIGGDIKGIMNELSIRYSAPFASFIIVFLGLALGSKYIRSSSALNIALVIILGYGYYVVQGIFEAYGKNGIINPFVAGWIPNLLFLALGIYLMRRAEY